MIWIGEKKERAFAPSPLAYAILIVSFSMSNSYTLSDNLYLRRICSRLGIKTSNNHAFRVAYNGRLLDANIDARDRCLVLEHSIQINERNYSFSDMRNAERVKDTLNLKKNTPA